MLYFHHFTLSFTMIWGLTGGNKECSFTRRGDQTNFESKCVKIRTVQQGDDIMVTKHCSNHPECRALADCINTTYSLFETLGMKYMTAKKRSQLQDNTISQADSTKSTQVDSASSPDPADSTSFSAQAGSTSFSAPPDSTSFSAPADSASSSAPADTSSSSVAADSASSSVPAASTSSSAPADSTSSSAQADTSSFSTPAGSEPVIDLPMDSTPDSTY